jgi:hypothetical protein
VEGGSKVRSYFVVDFDAGFVEQLRARSLFGIDWGSVTAVNAAGAGPRPRAEAKGGGDEPRSRDPLGRAAPAREAAAARRLAEYLERHCGPHLSALLLAGGERQAGGRMFSVTSRGEWDETQEKYIEFGRLGLSADLPRGQDPLILVALIKLLFERGEVTEEACTLTVDHTALLKLVGVKDSLEARRRLREALERYENLRFVEVIYRQSKKGPKKSGRGNLNRVLTYQAAETVTGGKAGWGTRLRVAVEFDYSFIDELRRGTLFGVDWQRVISISEVEPPAGV